MCVLMLLYMCPHTTVSVFSYYHMCVLILPCHTTIYVSSYICVLIPLCVLTQVFDEKLKLYITMELITGKKEKSSILILISATICMLLLLVY